MCQVHFTWRILLCGSLLRAFWNRVNHWLHLQVWQPRPRAITTRLEPSTRPSSDSDLQVLLLLFFSLQRRLWQQTLSRCAWLSPFPAPFTGLYPSELCTRQAQHRAGCKGVAIHTLTDWKGGLYIRTPTQPTVGDKIQASFPKHTR